ncbi:TonB-dependent receptor plug domain-containing protein [Frigoriflavimonas asaccharolytica]|uniref:TonB-linked SusC/RagA family outer membrane protein n=1 Tax=Frigoriflavimonas asaccharolytica TaxID=2735899 RepID=A0A8J8GBX2_9FLAO|nr:TonB-dependent receptor plug domain-containing protein [Frigoriflavimonas asaccharolytica]NRS93702.1 TonB-linked SusC/RagA family outer membrane protein [Frigoriflavimonas asaccharolytica]
MKKLTTSILAVVLTASFSMLSAQVKDTVKTQNIEEVVITGALGIKKNLNAVTAASQVVGTKELTQAVNPDAIQALTGKVSGLTITNTDVGVNGSSRIVLRGSRSLTGDGQALIVIDNVISSTAVLQQLPPDAIDNINVIKGLQGSALYGSQGVNGVVIVTTKKGTGSEKIQFNLVSSVDISSVYKLPEIQTKYGQGVQDTSFSSVDYNGTNFVPWENTSWGPAYNDPTIGGTLVPTGLPQADGNFLLAPYSPVKDHFKNFFKEGVIYQNGISMNVGGADSYAYLNLNRTTNEFIVEGDQSLKNSFLFKAGKRYGKFKIDGDFNYIFKNSTETSHDLYSEMIQMPSNIDIRNYRNSQLEGNYSIYALNPYWTTDNERYNNKSNFLSAVIGLQYDLTKNINFTYRGSLQNTQTTSLSYNNGFQFSRVYPNGTGLDGTIFSDYGTGDVVSFFNQSTSRSSNFYGDFLTNFNFDLTSDINLKANVGFNNQDRDFNINSVGGEQLKTPGFYNINNVLSPYPAYQLNNTTIRSRSFSLLGNVDLSYKNYLYVNGTYRKEYNSVLSVRPTDTGIQEVRDYDYFSAGMNFIPTNAFASLKGDILNYAKLSISYANIGNAPLNPYATDQIGVFPTGFPFGSNSSYIANQSPTSENIQREKVISKEASIALGFFRDRITLGGSYSRVDTKDLITRATASSASGLSSLQNNFGELRNNTYEADLGITPIKSRDFEVNMRGFYSRSETIVEDLPEGIDEINLLSYSTPAVGIFAIKGERFPKIKGTKFQRDPNGNIIVDASGNPLSTSTLEVLGNATPDYTLGFNMSVRVKNFTFAGTADYRHGSSFISLTKRLLLFTGAANETADYDRSQGYVIPGSVQNVGTAANPVYVANTTATGNSPDYSGATSYWTGSGRNAPENLLVDGTAFKIRELSMTYSVPKTVLSSTFITSASFGVYARNPFFFYADNNENYNDPETASSNGQAGGVAGDGQYPNYRSFGFNVNLTF